MPTSALLLSLVILAAGSCSNESAMPITEGAPRVVEPERFDPRLFARAAPAASPANTAVLEREAIVEDEPALQVGSTSPPLRVDGWLAGAAVTPRPGNIYVVEMWATWCKPCIEAMPHLSDLAARHVEQGVVVVAVNVEETEIDEVRQFARDHAADMRYHVAYDRSGHSQTQWIEAAGLPGLPASFVIDRNGRLAWIGHPSRLGSVVEAMVGENWDPSLARREASNARLAEPFAARLVELLETDPARGYQLARALMSGVLRDQPEYLHGLAYHVLAAPAVVVRDLELAEHASALANGATGWSNLEMLATLARIHEARGNTDGARALQRHVLDLSRGAAAAH